MRRSLAPDGRFQSFIFLDYSVYVDRTLCRECFAVMKCNDLIFGVGSVRINLKVLLVLEGSLIVGGLGCVVMSRN